MSLVTREDVEFVISRALAPNVQLQSYSLENYNKIKSGILSNHQILIVHVKNDLNSNITVHTFFVKTPPESSIILNSFIDEDMSEDEYQFFHNISPYMMKTYKGERWSPRYYLVKKNLLILEDLRSQGYSTPSSMILGEVKLKTALSSLARFHASSLLAEQVLGMKIKEHCPNSLKEKHYENKNKFGRSTAVGYDCMTQMTKRYKLDSGLIAKVYDRVYDLVRSQECGYNVVCHGDLWKNNLMFNDDLPPKCIIVDYQLLRYTSPVSDVAILIFVHTTPQFRKESEIDMFNHYYLAFHDALQVSNSEIKIPSYETMLKDYTEKRLIGMSYALNFLPGLYLKTKFLDDLMNDPVKLDNWFFNSRFPVVEANMNDDPVYDNQMKDLMYELFEEAKRIFKNS